MHPAHIPPSLTAPKSPSQRAETGGQPPSIVHVAPRSQQTRHAVSPPHGAYGSHAPSLPAFTCPLSMQFSRPPSLPKTTQAFSLFHTPLSPAQPQTEHVQPVSIHRPQMSPPDSSPANELPLSNTLASRIRDSSPNYSSSLTSTTTCGTAPQ
jgi:hypothetical protein